MRRSQRRPVNVQWSDVSAQWAHTAITATAATVLVQLQSPAALSNLTSDPPEDLTILRLVGDFRIVMATASGNWTLALTVADVTWTPGATVSVDNDKRLLWQQTYETNSANSTLWQPPGTLVEAAGTLFPAHPSTTHIDITPRVKVEAGKALYLVAYENTGAATFTTSSVTMRVLYKRSGRR